jgi:hypothetical protein
MCIRDRDVYKAENSKDMRK